MQRHPFLMENNSLSELKKMLQDWQKKELKDREVKIKRVIEQRSYKPIIVSIDDKYKPEEKQGNEENKAN